MQDTQREVIANVDRLNEYMDKYGFSAIVVRSGKEFTYLSGFAYPGTLARHLDFPDSPREVLLVWPRHGEPTMVLNNYAAPLARRDSWLQSIELYDDYVESPYEVMAGLISKMGLQVERVGFEKTYLSAARWEELHRTVAWCGDAGLHRDDGAGALGQNAGRSQAVEGSG